MLCCLFLSQIGGMHNILSSLSPGLHGLLAHQKAKPGGRSQSTTVRASSTR